MMAVEAAEPRVSIDGLVAVHRRLKNRRAIVDAEALARAIDADWVETDTPDGFRPKALATLRKAMDDGREEIERRLLRSNDGAEAVRATAYLMDTVVREAIDIASERVYRTGNKTRGEEICAAAVGGYGRGELAPHSDIDLLFLLPYKKTPLGEQVIEYVLYLLWDLRLKVGHATRSIDECIRQARADMTIRTAMLESRYIWGSEALFGQLRYRFQTEIEQGTALEFVEAKLQESDRRHARNGDSRYVIEPNIKDGKGGLRDLHKLFWIGKYVYQVNDVSALVPRGVLTLAEARRFAKAQKLLWTIRCHLHLLTGRAEERLTVDLQPRIAERLGYTDRNGLRAVERFMKHYYLTAKDVGDLTRIYCAAVEAEHRRRPRLRLSRLFGGAEPTFGDFRVDGDRLNVKSDDVFEADPANLIRLFHTAQQHDLEFHPHALRLVTQSLKLVDADLKADPEANRLFVEILSSRKGPERVLRRMNEAQVFGRFVPDFGRVVAQMQYDMYHVYTVDEHTIIMLGILWRIEQGELAEAAPIATEVVHKLQSRRALYVATLIHDIAKGRNGDHSILGARVARRLCPRLGMTEEETETVAWLVRWHLLMSHAAFKRDVNDPKTIRDFCEIVRSPERLRLLLVLTVADIRAVGPNVWNGWKASLLRELYWRADDLLSGHASETKQKARVQAAQNAMRPLLAGWEEAEVEAHLARGYPSYWLAFDPDSHARHATMIRDAERDGRKLEIHTRVDGFHEVTEVTIYTTDHPGLFARVAGAMASVGANIVGARIFTMANGMALDVFDVQDERRGPFDRPDRLAKLSVAVEKSLGGRLSLTDAIDERGSTLPKRVRGMTVAPRVLIDNTASTTHTVIEVNGTDRPGLLWRLTRRLSDVGLQISSAKISTYGESIVDVFYVKDVFGLKIDNDRKLAEIREALLGVLSRQEARAAAE